MPNALMLATGPGTAISGATTRYMSLCSGGLRSDTTQTPAQITYRVAGILSNLYARVITMTGSASTLALQKNGGAGNQSLSLTGVGEFEDVINTDEVAAGDEINLILTVPASSTIGITIQSVLFNAATSGTTIIGASTIESIAAATYFVGLGGAAALVTTEAQGRVKTYIAGEMRNLFVNCPLNARANTTTVRVRADGGDVAIVLSIPGNTTGFFEDLTNDIDPQAAGGFLGYKVVGT